MTKKSCFMQQTVFMGFFRYIEDVTHLRLKQNLYGYSEVLWGGKECYAWSAKLGKLNMGKSSLRPFLISNHDSCRKSSRKELRFPAGYTSHKWAGEKIVDCLPTTKINGGRYYAANLHRNCRCRRGRCVMDDLHPAQTGDTG